MLYERAKTVQVLDDEKIVSLFFQREEDAIKYLKEKYGKLCLYIANNVLADGRDAEECVNDACLKVWNAIPPQRPKSLGAFVSTITRNLALDRYGYNNAARRSSALTEAFEELEAVLPSMEGPGGRNEEFADFLNGFLRELKKEARVFFVRRYWYGESIRDIAEAYCVSEEKVKSSLFRTRKKFAKALKKEGVGI